MNGDIVQSTTKLTPVKRTLTVACARFKSDSQALCRAFYDAHRRLSSLRRGLLRPVHAALLFAPLSVLPAAEPLTNSVGIRLVPIEAGTFTMGQDGPLLEDYMGQKRLGEMYKDFDRIDFDEKPAHKVTITQPFLMGSPRSRWGNIESLTPASKRAMRS